MGPIGLMGPMGCGWGREAKTEKTEKVSPANAGSVTGVQNAGRLFGLCIYFLAKKFD